MEVGNYEILVAEPWDYESRDGKNSIKGEIIKIVSGKCAVFKSNFLLEFNKLESHYLILTPRMKDGDFYSENITSTIINGALLMQNFSLNYIEEQFLMNSKFVLIGDIKELR